jgi:hypothetical protein
MFLFFYLFIFLFICLVIFFVVIDEMKFQKIFVSKIIVQCLLPHMCVRVTQVH